MTWYIDAIPIVVLLVIAALFCSPVKRVENKDQDKEEGDSEFGNTNTEDKGLFGKL